MQLLLILIFFSNISIAELVDEGAAHDRKGAGAFSMQEKPSLKTLGEQLKDTSGIASLFIASKNLVDPVVASDKLDKKSIASLTEKIEKLWKDNESVIKIWLKNDQDSNPYLRGEIDEEKVLNNLLFAVQLSILKARVEVRQRQWTQVKLEMAPWFVFASDLTYDEASLISLRLANLVRSLLLDDLESMESLMQSQFSAKDLESWENWVTSIRSSWPIDRVLLTEAKKTMGGRALYTAQKVAAALQKNAYQTAAEALKEAPGPKPPELKQLETMWRDQDILAMKTEVHRFTALRIRLAKNLFVKNYSREPARIEDLVEKHLLASVPIDYISGRPFTLSEAALH